VKLRRIGGLASGQPPLRAEDYRLLRDLVNERLGVYYGPDSRGSLERRLRERLAVRGLTSFGDYYQLLKFGDAQDEWEEAAELLTTHETYFFREDYQLRAFKNELLPQLAEAGRARRRLHIWSAGCSTGEEAYSVAILVLESGLFDGWEVRVYGSDVSKKCIAAARRGVYATPAFRTTPDAVRSRWFRQVDGAYAVSDSVRALCHFGQMNLLDDERTQLIGRVDVVFCRNVLIYFDAASRRRVIDMFHERLDQGGVLLLGHSESLLNVSTAFELLHLSEDLVYRKPTLAPR
jgi:chemotaxis protein methyltransferase CheR